MPKAIQAKHVPIRPVLEFLAGPPAEGSNLPFMYAVWQPREFPNCVQRAMPEGIPDKIALAKMRALIHSGLVDGCGCGCPGGFTITPKGREWLADPKN